MKGLSRRTRAVAAAALVLPLAVVGVPGASQAAPRTVAADAAAPDSRVPGPAARAKARKKKFPTARNTGVPRRWKPRRTIRGDHVVTRDGAVVKNLRIRGDLVIAARNVKVRRVEVLGGSVDNWRGSTCHTGLKLARVTIKKAPGQVTSGHDPAIQAGGYVANRVKIAGLPEGFRVGGKSACGPVVVRNSYARVVAPDECGDWHGDALQGYDGGRLKVRNSRLDLVERPGCGGTAPFFYPSGQGNTAVDIDRLIVNGGGYSFRLGTPGSVRNLKIVRGGYHYGPIHVDCSALDRWRAHVVKLNRKGQPKAQRSQRCNTRGGD